MGKEGNRRMHRPKMSPHLSFELTLVLSKTTFTTFLPPPLPHSPPPTTRWYGTTYAKSLHLHWTADQVFRSPWKFIKKLKWHYLLLYYPISFFNHICSFPLLYCTSTERMKIVYIIRHFLNLFLEKNVLILFTTFIFNFFLCNAKPDWLNYIF